jgi:cholesterol transport system auxiliary component
VIARRWTLSLLSLALAGCALLGSKAPPFEVNYYTPPITEPGERGSPPGGIRIRLGRVFAASHLRARIAYRTSPVSVELYETRRWTESPDAYVRRELESALFERGALVTGGNALELDVEVLAFEEVRGPPAAGRVRLRYVLVDRRTVVASGVVDVAREASGDFGAIVVAIGSALGEASDRIVSEVVGDAGKR